MPIKPNAATTISTTLSVGGVPLSIPPSAAVTAKLREPLTQVQLGQTQTASFSAIGANWGQGLVVFDFAATDTAGIAPPSVNLEIRLTEGAQQRTFMVSLAVSDGTVVRSALFVRSEVLPRLRARIASVVANYLDGEAPDDDALWSKVLASEGAVQRLLQTFLTPTTIFSVAPPTAAEIAALGGKPYFVEGGYDLPPDFFTAGPWGLLRLRQTPVVSVASVQIVYPSQIGPVFAIPPEWFTLDPKSGQLNIVPGPNGFSAPLGVFALSALSSNVTVPQMLRPRYVAGLTPDHPAMPEVMDLVLRMVGLKLIQDAFVPSSGSISADGLSQSQSFDPAKAMDMLEGQAEALRQSIKGPVYGGIA